MPGPQLAAVPSGTSVSTQTDVPVAQLVSHRVQEPVGVQVVPAVQTTHAPSPSQTWPGPQVVPPATGSVDGVHTGAPELQAIRDCVHAPASVQSWPSTHEMQPPAPLHTRPEPQLEPGAVGVAVGLHTGAPVEQSIRCSKQEPGGVQSRSCVQAAQVPAPSQTSPVPQVVPGATGSAVGVHTGAPEPQAIRDIVHAFGGVQSWPSTHAMHWPAGSQTLPASHDAPVASGVVVSTHRSAPLPQLVCQSVQEPGGVQLVPAVQETQVPVGSQTMFVPHVAPVPSS